MTITVEVQNSDYTARKPVSNTACVDGSTAANGSGPLAQKCSTWTITTPVTVAYFAASRTETACASSGNGDQTGNAGFNIYVETANGRQKVNESLILSEVVDSLEPQAYSLELSAVAGESFYIEDVSIMNESRMHGPFTAGEAYGARQEKEAIAWPSIHIENDALAAGRAAANRAAAEGQGLQAAPPNRIDQAVTMVEGLFDKVLGQEAMVAEAGSYPALDPKIEEDGIYRVRYEDVAAVAGSSLNGAPMGSLALTNQGQPVALYISSAGGFGPGQYFDFYGEDWTRFTVTPTSTSYRWMLGWRSLRPWTVRVPSAEQGRRSTTWRP